jgi:polyisoprenyl-phosphate glycosyltransferase
MATMSEVPGAGDGAALRPLVSVVIPALDEAENVPDMLTRFGEFAVANPRYDFELVLVDDGSGDGTADLVLDLAKPDSRVTVVRLARSFGSHYAISAGLTQCAGDCAIVLGADLQEPPSLLADFLTHWEQGSEVVWGVRRSRAGRSAAQEFASKAFSLLFTRYANLANYPPEGPSGVLVDRCVIDEVGRMPEHNRNVLALIAWLGFTQTRVDYDQQARRHGESKWTRRKMVKLAVDSLIQFSAMPLRVCSLGGMAVAGAGMLYALLLVIRSLAGVNTPSGWPTVIVIVLVLGGTQLTVIGIIGEYLWRAVEESRNRPLYVIRDVRVAGANQSRRQSPRRGRRPTGAPIQPPSPDMAPASSVS